MNVWCVFDAEASLVGIYGSRDKAAQARQGMEEYGWYISERWVQ